ncbi:MAG: hypothetical protein MZU95_14950 [Desulfomicrobium escambiense]|nr:hypothetical protein [Desulfomicrobium escambiense]
MQTLRRSLATAALVTLIALQPPRRRSLRRPFPPRRCPWRRRSLRGCRRTASPASTRRWSGSSGRASTRAPSR